MEHHLIDYHRRIAKRSNDNDEPHEIRGPDEDAAVATTIDRSDGGADVY